jgi:DHA1 family tetracycline resistance protein-like MFS transporter
MYTKYRYQWGPAQVGISLAAVGVMAAIVQGGLTRSVVGWLGEIRTVRLSLLMTACIFIGYGISSQPWMIYVCIVVGSLAGLVTPAVQGLMSQTVPADEQGSLQGALTSLTSIASVIGPIMSTYVFGYFISDRAPVHLPGAAFYLSSLLALAALGVAMPALRRLTRHSEPVPESSPALSSH